MDKYHISSMDIIIFLDLQMGIIRKKHIKLMHKIIRFAGIIRFAVIIWGRVLLEEIRYIKLFHVKMALCPLIVS